MGSPSNNANGSTCTLVERQSHLSISTTEDDGSNTATEFYQIKWTGFATTEDCRGATDGTNTVPVRSNAHPENTALNARRVEIRPNENNTRQYFQARIEYADDETTPTNPLEAKPVIEWTVGADEKVPYFLDNDPAGPKMVLNAAGDRFAEFLQRYSGTVSATYSINVPLTGTATGYNGSTVSAFNLSQAVLYTGGGTNQSSPSTNSDVFTFDGQTIQIGQGLTKNCTCGPDQIQNGVQYRVQKWTLLFKTSWIDVVDNRGFNQKVTVNGNQVLQPITKGGTPDKVDFPWPLTVTGAASPNVNDTPLGLTFYPYPQRAFAPLGFS